MEHGFHKRLQDHFHDCLRHSIGHSGNPQRSHATVILRYLDKPHGRWKVRARRHPIPDLVEIVLQVLLKRRQCLAVHPRSTAVRQNPLVRFPNELLRNAIRLCFRHRFLPLLVDQHLRPESRAPSLHPGYRASTLLRARPSLRLASVLGSSRVFRLEFSLGIEAIGSHVPHKSLCRAHAALAPVITRAVSRHPPRLVPGQRLEPGFDDVPTLSTRCQRFTHVRLPGTYLTGLSRLFRLAHHPSHWTGAASGGLDPEPAPRVRGTCPHLLCSKAASSRPLHHGLLSAPSWRTVVRVTNRQVHRSARPSFTMTEHAHGISGAGVRLAVAPTARGNVFLVPLVDRRQRDVGQQWREDAALRCTAGSAQRMRPR